MDQAIEDGDNGTLHEQIGPMTRARAKQAQKEIKALVNTYLDGVQDEDVIGPPKAHEVYQMSNYINLVQNYS